MPLDIVFPTLLALLTPDPANEEVDSAEKIQSTVICCNTTTCEEMTDSECDEWQAPASIELSESDIVSDLAVDEGVPTASRLGAASVFVEACSEPMSWQYGAFRECYADTLDGSQQLVVVWPVFPPELAVFPWAQNATVGSCFVIAPDASIVTQAEEIACEF
jgi:hypothetical protein